MYSRKNYVVKQFHSWAAILTIFVTRSSTATLFSVCSYVQCSVTQTCQHCYNTFRVYQEYWKGTIICDMFFSNPLNTFRNQLIPILGRMIGKHVKSYFSETSLHGLKYITEDNRPAVERILWTVLCLLGFFLAIFFMEPST